MAFPNKVNIPIAANRNSQHDLSAVHITTSDFMQFSVAKAMELVPKQSIEFGHQLFTRLAPMPLPTFGFVDIINRAYFVPFRTVWPAWNDFITDTPHLFDNGSLDIPTSTPLITKSLLVNLFLDSSFSFTSNQNDSPDFHYCNYGGDGTVINSVYKSFTPFGRFAYKLLRSLGYNWTFSSLDGTKTFGALPLLCVCRVYMDYYYPSAYANDEESAWLNSWFIRNTSPESLMSITVNDLKRLFNILHRVAYPSDYFTSAWDNPTGPNAGLSSDIHINDINDVNTANTLTTEPVTQVSNVYNNDTQRTEAVIKGYGVDSPITKLSNFALTALRGLSDYLKRHQLAGSRAIDRYLARFGVKLPAANLNRSVFITEYKNDLQIGDVTATSDTQGAHLGSYAGKGVGLVEGELTFQTDENGMFIIISIIQPRTYYFEGVNRQVYHKSKLDFFTPEFDNLGAQAIANSEVYTPIDGDNDSSKDKIFGFVPRYAEYKVSHSQITGDFLCNSYNTGMDSWYLFRSLKPFVDGIGGVGNLVHSYEFIMGMDADQYKRIFYTTTSANRLGMPDHFHIIHNFRIKSNFPGKSLFDSYEFENEDEAQKVTFDVNGTTH